MFRQRTSLQDGLCTAIRQTVGVCMKTDLPACFSSRERNFIKENMVDDFKDIFTVVEARQRSTGGRSLTDCLVLQELLGIQLNFSASDCGVWEPVLTASASSNSVPVQPSLPAIILSCVAILAFSP